MKTAAELAKDTSLKSLDLKKAKAEVDDIAAQQEANTARLRNLVNRASRAFDLVRSASALSLSKHNSAALSDDASDTICSSTARTSNTKVTSSSSVPEEADDVIDTARLQAVQEQVKSRQFASQQEREKHRNSRGSHDSLGHNSGGGSQTYSRPTSPQVPRHHSYNEAEASDEEASDDDLNSPSPQESFAKKHNIPPLPRMLSNGANRVGTSMKKIVMGKADVVATDKVRVFVATWNVGNSMPQKDQLEQWLPTDPNNACEVIVVGVQECSYHMDKSDRLTFKGFKKEVEAMKTPRGAGDSSNPMSPGLPHRTLSRATMNTLQSMQKLHLRKSLSIATVTDKLAQTTGNRNKKDVFDTMIQMHFGSKYRKITSTSLGDMRLIVLCKASLKKHVSHVKTAKKATGVGGVIGNKGGMMAKIRVFDTDLCFLSCHLAAHEGEDKVARRNHDVFEILRACSAAGKQRLDIAQRYHHCFLFGDLNYRINMSIATHETEIQREEHHDRVVQHIQNQEFKKLYKADQLQREMKSNNVLRGFRETPPRFEPTFKVVRGCEMAYNPHRIPSYCDRILWTSLPGHANKISQMAYDSVNSVTSSDHKPVISVFSVNVSTMAPETSRHNALSPRHTFRAHRRGGEAQLLRFTRLKASGISDEMYDCPDLVLKIHSQVTAGEKVLQGLQPPESETNFLVDLWFDSVDMPLKIRQHDLLGTHVTLTVWDRSKSKKLLGMAVVSLDEWCNKSDFTFSAYLLRYGVACGELNGRIDVVSETDRHSFEEDSATGEVTSSFVERFQSGQSTPHTAKSANSHKS